MPISHSHSSKDPDHEGLRYSAHLIFIILAIAGVIAVVLCVHGSWWWRAPLALLALLAAHMAVVGALASFANTRHGKLGFHSRESGADGLPGKDDILLHSPRRYDLLAGAVTLGQEGKLRQWTLDLADLRSEEMALDVGCGTGSLLLAASERLSRAGALHGVELSPEMAGYARRKAKKRGVDMTVVQGTAENLPYKSASFDAAFCTLALHHMSPQAREGAIREMSRILRPGGRAVIVDWQIPESKIKALASPLFLVYLMHSIGPKQMPLDELGVEAMMNEMGFKEIVRSSFGPGGAVGAVVGRLAEDCA